MEETVDKQFIYGVLGAYLLVNNLRIEFKRINMQESIAIKKTENKQLGEIKVTSQKIAQMMEDGKAVKYNQKNINLRVLKFYDFDSFKRGAHKYFAKCNHSLNAANTRNELDLIKTTLNEHTKILKEIVAQIAEDRKQKDLTKDSNDFM